MRARAVVAVCFAVAMLCGAAASGRAQPAGSPAAPPIAWGVADDMSKYADDGGSWFYGMLQGANLTENRWTLAWDPANPTAITELPFVERAAPKAQEAGVHVVLALYSKQASQHDPNGFCAWAATVATTVSQWGIHDYIVWNEPNTRLYWVPQKDDSGKDVAAPAYEQLLAKCYDALHAADPLARVIGLGLSPRASTSASTEPLVFLRDVGAAYRASGRRKPIMDQLSIHPYPNPSKPTNPPSIGYQSTDRFGIPDLARVKQAVWDAFNGTGQPTTLNGLTFRIDEVGWQTDTSTLPQYVNQENVPVVTEQTQADYLGTMAATYFACDPTVTDVELFLLVDERYRNGKDATGKVVGGGWQSGLLTAGGEGVSAPKLAYAEDAALFGEGRAACTGVPTSWLPAGWTGANGSGGNGTATVGGADGLIGPGAVIALQSLLGNVSALQSHRRPLQRPSAVKLATTYRTVLAALLRAAGASESPLEVSGTVVGCTAGARCSVDGALAGRPARSYRVVAAGRQTLDTGGPLALTLSAVGGVTPPAGSYYLVVVLRSTGSAAARYAVAAQVRPVTVPPLKARP